MTRICIIDETVCIGPRVLQIILELLKDNDAVVIDDVGATFPITAPDCLEAPLVSLARHANYWERNTGKGKRHRYR